MALIVEDGTGLANADSYISLANAIAYLNTRNLPSLPLVDPFLNADQGDQENALRIATEYMVSEYRFRWAGYRRTQVQSLDWPRVWVPITDAAGYGGYGGYPAYFDPNSVPAQVAQACADLATRALSADLAPDIERIEKTVRVGPISVEYDTNQAVATLYRAVKNKLAPFLVGNASRTSLIRT